MPLNLTDSEQKVLDHLADAFNAWVGLLNRTRPDDDEMTVAIHDAQKLVAVRVARRVDPGVWRRDTTRWRREGGMADQGEPPKPTPPDGEWATEGEQPKEDGR